MINTSKIEEQKNITGFLHDCHDESQFWHKYNKVLGRNNNAIMEPVINGTTNEYILKYQQISEQLIQHHIEKISKRCYNASFKKNIEKDLSDALKIATGDIENVFFVEADIKHAIKTANKDAAPRPALNNGRTFNQKLNTASASQLLH